jgi:penicillin-binding protein 2
VVTPISLLRAIASIGVHGKMYVPHLMKEFKPIGAMGEEGSSNYFAARSGFGFDRPEPKMVPMTDEQYELMVKGMWGVVQGGGTGAGIRIPGFDIAGKTGTAQNSVLNSGGAKDHAWFVSFAPAFKPEIAVIGLIENVGFGGTHAAPAVKGVYETYIATRYGGIPPADASVEPKLVAQR